MRGHALLPVYRKRESPFQRARVASSLLFLFGLGAVIFTASQPLLLAGALLAAAVVALLSGAWRDMGVFWVAAVAVPPAVILINSLVAHQGLTVLVVGPTVPVLGAVDVTLEEAVYGALMAVRLSAALVLAGLFSVAIDPDGALRLFRRFGFKSAMTASLATRMVQVLSRDAQRLADAQRCRFGGGHGGRLGRIRRQSRVLGALLTTSLERGIDVAVALETRGFGRAQSVAIARERWTLPDLLFACAGAALTVIAALALLTGVGQMQVYPVLGSAFSWAVAALAATTVAVAVLPFALLRGLFEGGYSGG